MRIAIIYKDKEIFIEFSPDKFKLLLNKYFEQYKNINIAIDKIIQDIKSEVIKK